MSNHTEKDIILSNFIKDGFGENEINIFDDQHFVKFTLRFTYNDHLAFSENKNINLSRLHELYFNIRNNSSRLVSIRNSLMEYQKIKPILSYLEWINLRNRRQCIFVQSMLNFIEPNKRQVEPTAIYQNIRNIFDIPILITNTKTKFINDLFIGETLLSNSSARAIDLISDFFIISHATLESKIATINKIKEMYASASSENKIGEWIKKEKPYGCIEWLEQQPAMNNADFDWLASQKVAGGIDYFIIYLDLLFALKPDTAHLYTGRIKKAWSQKKTRDKNKAKSQYNFIMSPDIKVLLNEVCEAANISRNDLVEAAIRNEYKRFKSAIR